ncbi:hypothetical protein FACS189456_7570 [Bacteroidia bacterium]|nr:hypothetical protein FACS189456_7570 [Bacteroidia bacterium]
MQPNTISVRENIKELRSWAKENLLGRTVQHPEFPKAIHFTSSGVKEFLNQPHRNFFEKNEMIKTITIDIPQSSIIDNAPDLKGNENLHYYYLKTTVAGNKSYFVIRYDKKEETYTLYSIVDRIWKNR